MSKDIVPLTDEQRELAERNHNLIYKFAYKRNILIDEYYGILAIGLCKAAQIYDSDKGMFSSVAFRCMENELCMYWRSLQKKSCIPNELIYSIDSDGKSFKEPFDSQPFINLEYDIMIEELKDILNDNEMNIIKMLLDGKIQSEIAEKMGCKRQNVGYYIKEIKKKIEHLFYN